LGKLTQTLLEFAQASGDAGGLQLQPVRMDEVLMEMPAEMKKISPDYSVVISFGHMPAEEDQLIVFGNAQLLFTAIKNIVVNACKYSADHRAMILLDRQDKEFVISIEDKGIGMPQTELAHIFQPFYRINHTGEHTGFGLGLSLAYRILKLHKGDITVSSSPAKAPCSVLPYRIVNSNPILILN
jgi:two-component system sensor histidine kinase ArlS